MCHHYQTRHAVYVLGRLENGVVHGVCAYTRLGCRMLEARGFRLTRKITCGPSAMTEQAKEELAKEKKTRHLFRCGMTMDSRAHQFRYLSSAGWWRRLGQSQSDHGRWACAIGNLEQARLHVERARMHRTLTF